MKTLLSTLLILMSMAPIQAEQCKDRLGSQLQTLPSWLTEKNQAPALDTSCIDISMDVFRNWAQTFNYVENGEKGFFLYCSEEGEQMRSNLPQCQDETYMSSITNSFDAVVDCLDIDPVELFPIVASESGFYHNAYSISGTDIGFGQITTPAISDVTMRWNEFIGLMENTQKKSCKQIIEFVESHAITTVEDNYACELTKAPVNPLLNALYTGIHYKIISGYMEDYFAQSQQHAMVKTFLGERYSDSVMKQIKRNLTVLSYNLGYVATTNAFEDYLALHQNKFTKLNRERDRLSAKMAKIYLQLKFSTPADESERAELEKAHASYKAQRDVIDADIAKTNAPQIFSGDEKEPTSFGAYIVNNSISRYLKLIHGRIDYIGAKDQKNLCPTDNFLHIIE